MDQLSELKAILARRKAAADAGDEPKKDSPGPASMGGRVEDPNEPSPLSSSDDKDKEKDDDDDDDDEMPDFSL